MDKGTVQAIGSVLNFYGTPASVGGTAVALGKEHGSLNKDTASSILSSSVGLLQMFGKEIPNPLNLAVSTTALINDTSNILSAKQGEVKNSDCFAAASDLTAILSTATLMVAAAGAGAVSAPVWVGVGVVAGLASAALTVCSLASGDSTSSAINEMIQDLKSNFDKFTNAAGDLASDALNKMQEGINNICSLIDQGINDVQKLAEDIYDSIGNTITDILNSIDAAKSFLSETGNSLIDKIKGLFDTAENTKSPLVIDLDGDGVETISSSTGVHFDLDNNTFAETTGWVGKDDGLLVLDKNNNDTIDNGSELFGNNTALKSGANAANGFAALADLDSNADGKIDKSDTAFSQLKIWKDANSNGVTDAGELISLADASIQSISTSYNSQTVTDSQGNAHSQTGSVTKTDGSTAAVDDVWFKVDTARTVDLAKITISEEMAGLPDIAGFGNVHSLHVAMALDTTGHLTDLIKQYVSTADSTLRTGLINSIIYAWAGVENIDPESRAATKIYGNVIGDARELVCLERFLGEEYLGTWCWGEKDPNPHGQAAPYLIQAYQELTTYVSLTLLAQTELKPYYDAITLSWNAPTNNIEFNIQPIVSLLKTKYETNSAEAIEDISNLYKSLKMQGATGTEIINKLSEKGNISTEGFKFYLGAMGRNIVSGDAANNTLSGTTSDDVLLGFSGNDTLNGDNGNDILDGGAGNDNLSGGYGSDTYRFGKGSGQDTINNAAYNDPNAADIISLTELNAADVTLRRSGNDLMIYVNGTNDSLRVSAYFNGDGVSDYGYAVDRIRFSDGNKYSFADVVAHIDLSADIPGQIISGTNIADKLIGSAGGDTLYGGDGNDFLDGGCGNDTLNGGNGNDTYLFGKGSGQDTIYYAYDSAAGKVDTIKLAGLNAADISLSRSGNDLLLLVNDSNDSMRVVNHFSNDATGGYQIDKIVFADGTSWNQAVIKSTVLVPTSADDVLFGYATSDTIIAMQGDDTIYGNDGNDVADGGSGYDKLYGGNGDDQLKGGSQDDLLNGDAGNDKLYGQDSQDSLYGGDGNDFLDGGSGNDTLNGGNGNDTYLFGKGSGQDVISDYDPTSGNLDVLKLQDLSSNQLWFTQTGNSLNITVIGTSDNVTISNWYSGNAYHIEQFKSADGKTLLDSQVASLVSAMASLTPPAAGQTTLSQNYQEQLSTVFAANWK